MAVGPRTNEAAKSVSVFGGYFLFAGLISYYFKEVLFISDAVPSCVTGIIFGPFAANVINPFEWFNHDEETYINFTLQLSRLVIGFQVLITGINLPQKYIKTEWKSLTMLLLPIMTLAWLLTGLLIWAIIPGLSYIEALVISGCVTPTDPVLANSICKGRFAETFVPLNVRALILGESGANDGLALPYLTLAIYLVKRLEPGHEMSVGSTIWHWVYEVFFYQVMMGMTMGLLIGYAARKALRYAHDRSLIDHESFLAFGIAVTLFILGFVYLAGASDILACFLAGCVLNWDGWFQEECAGQAFGETVDMYIGSAIFIYTGAVLPIGYWNATDNVVDGWRIVILGIAVLALRRLPLFVATTRLLPALKDWKEAAFAGYFGPIGVGTLYWTCEALHQLHPSPTADHLREVLLPVNYFLIVFSVLVHGTSIAIFQGGRTLVGKGYPTPKDDDPIPIRPGADIHISRTLSRPDRGLDLSLSRTSTRRQPAREYLSRHISIPNSTNRGDQYRSQLDLALERSSTRRQSARDYLSTTSLALGDYPSQARLDGRDVHGDDEDDVDDGVKTPPVGAGADRGRAESPAPEDRDAREGRAPQPQSAAHAAQAEWIKKGRMARGEPVDGWKERPKSISDASDNV